MSDLRPPFEEVADAVGGFLIVIGRSARPMLRLRFLERPDILVHLRNIDAQLQVRVKSVQLKIAKSTKGVNAILVLFVESWIIDQVRDNLPTRIMYLGRA